MSKLNTINLRQYYDNIFSILFLLLFTTFDLLDPKGLKIEFKSKSLLYSFTLKITLKELSRKTKNSKEYQGKKRGIISSSISGTREAIIGSSEA